MDNLLRASTLVLLLLCGFLGCKGQPAEKKGADDAPKEEKPTPKLPPGKVAPS